MFSYFRKSFRQWVANVWWKLAWLPVLEKVGRTQLRLMCLQARKDKLMVLEKVNPNLALLCPNLKMTSEASRSYSEPDPRLRKFLDILLYIKFLNSVNWEFFSEYSVFVKYLSKLHKQAFVKISDITLTNKSLYYKAFIFLTFNLHENSIFNYKCYNENRYIYIFKY